jgi:3-isopropylmalate/(R)-2-methylmalate dehydratase small subunit
MDKFTTHKGLAVPLDAANVDTDQIMPKQFLKRVERSGFGEFLFYNWRFRKDGSPNPDFVLNHPRYAGASLLLARDNFGGGSSREHAPWALADYGFKAIIAPSFADIFKNNCLAIGLLTVELESDLVEELFQRTQAREGYGLEVDLQGQTITGDDGFSCGFDIEPQRKRRLLEGLDDIGLTLALEADIAEYERTHQEPWRAAVSQPHMDRS